MPTRADFETAAAKFQSASAQVGHLANSADAAAVAKAIQGGSLGRQVTERIAASSETARSCQPPIDEAAEECLRRVAVIVEYEVRLAAYDAAYKTYQQASLYYKGALDRWWLDTTGDVEYPGDPPVAPDKPDPPPAWADVRRP